jgi:MFS family permease
MTSPYLSVRDSQVLPQAADIEGNPVEELSRAIRKAHLRIGPFLALMFAVSILDRSNVGFSKEALRMDVHIGDTAYALGAGIFFVGYAVFEVPSNFILQRVGAKKWLSSIMIAWGIASALMMFVHNETSFYLLRFLVGVTEAGFSPGVVLYSTYWFPSRERGKALGIYYMGLPASLTLGSVLSGWLMQVMNGYLGIRNWQWMFLIEGMAASIVGVIAFFFLSDRPSEAKWLTAKERASLELALSREEQQRQPHSPRGSLAALADFQVLRFIAIYFTIQVGIYGTIFYLPSRLSLLTGSALDSRIGLLIAIPWLVALLSLPLITALADRRGEHRLFATALLSLATLGMAASIESSHLSLTLLAFCIAATGFVVVQPLFWTLPTAYLRGSAAATGIAVIGSFGNLGGFVAPTFKTFIEKLSRNQNAGTLALACITMAGAALLAHTSLNNASEGPTTRRGE